MLHKLKNGIRGRGIRSIAGAYTDQIIKFIRIVNPKTNQINVYSCDVRGYDRKVNTMTLIFPQIVWMCPPME